MILIVSCGNDMDTMTINRIDLLPKRIQIFSPKNESFLLKVRTNTWDIHHIHVNIKHRLTYTVNRLYPLLVDKHCCGYMLKII